MKIHLSSHPQIHVTFHYENSVLLRVSLALSDEGFTSESFNAPQSEKEKLLVWLHGYIEGVETGRTELLKLPGMSLFSQNILLALQEIPFGKVASYWEMATQARSPRAARAVGSACHRNPFPLLIPCHRVIKADGSIGGFAANIEIKRRLLAFENYRLSGGLI